jgi:hypothetical protein
MCTGQHVFHYTHLKGKISRVVLEPGKLDLLRDHAEWRYITLDAHLNANVTAD